MKKKLLSFILSAAMVFTMIPSSVFAATQGSVHLNTVTTTPAPAPSNINMPTPQTKAKIMLDAGHYAYYNQGVYKSYWESKAMWTLTEAMASELDAYEGITVGKTRTEQSKDLAVYTRGTKAKGYDLFISNHTNSSSSASNDYPMVILPYETNLLNKAKPIAKQIVTNMKSTIGTKEATKMITRTYTEGGKIYDYYGVIRGAASVGVPGMIFEHSFHTNKAACSWLLSDANLQKLGTQEADIIASYYGAKKQNSDTATATVETTKVTTDGEYTNTITINSPSSAFTYEIYRGLEGGTYSKIATVSGLNAKYEDSSAVSGSNNYYIVRPVTSTTVGQYSSPVGVTMPGVAPPKFDAYGYKAGLVKVTWDKVNDAKEYDIYRSDTANGTYSIIKTITSTDPEWTTGAWLDKDTTFTTSTSNVDKYYKVKVKADLGGQTWTSSDVTYNGATAKVTLGKLTFDAYGYGVGMAKITWKPTLEYADSYMIQRATSKTGTYKTIETFTDKTSTYIDKDVTKGADYYYKVIASYKVTDFSPAKTFYSGGKSPADTAPNGVTVIGNLGKTSMVAYGYGVDCNLVKWFKAKNANGYRVYRATSKSGTYKYIKKITSGNTLSYKDKAVTKGKTYYYKVMPFRQTDSLIVKGSLTKYNAAKVLSKVSRATISAKKYSSTKVKVSWKKATGATGYQIWRATGSKGKYVKLGYVSNYKAGSYIAKSLKKGKTYYFKVRSYSTVNKTYYGSFSKYKKVKM